MIRWLAHGCDTIGLDSWLSELGSREWPHMIKSTEHLYVVTDDGILSGEPIIVGTRTPVRAIVELWRQGIAPESIPTHLPHLTLAQIFDALSYYSDHQDELNGYIARNHVPDDLIDPHISGAL